MTTADPTPRPSMVRRAMPVIVVLLLAVVFTYATSAMGRSDVADVTPSCSAAQSPAVDGCTP